MHPSPGQLRQASIRFVTSILAATAIFVFVFTPARGNGWLDVRPRAAAATPTPIAPDRRMLMAYYFYWYDAQTGGHLTENSGIRYHLPPTPPPDWRSVDWHKRQLADMAYAGIDTVLAVYWGNEHPLDTWSQDGLPILAQAAQSLRADGVEPPKIGLFLDTTIVEMRDLTTAAGKEWFYAQFREFFARIPREQWAVIRGQPVAFLFTSDFTAAMSQDTFDYVYARFQAEFGVRPYIVREVSWDYPILRWEAGTRVRDYTRAIQTENSYLWNAAVHGYVDAGGVAAVGPGYDDRLIPGRGGTVQDRQGGLWYQSNFGAAIASGKPLIAIETWNEIHEGSGISDTVELGRQYLDLTRPIAQAFKGTATPPASPSPISATPSVTATPTRTPTPGPICSPRPPIRVTVARLSPGMYRVVLEATSTASLPVNVIQQIRFGRAENGQLDLWDGTANSPGNIVRTVPPGVSSTSLVLRRTSPGVPVTVPLTVTDACGEWTTLVGAGAGAQ